MDQREPIEVGDTVRVGPHWTGEVRLIEKDLDAPLRWRKPQTVAVCFGGDLFHPSVPDEWIDRVFAVMALCDGKHLRGRRRSGDPMVPQHTMLVLTKRAERMRAYLTDPETPYRVAAWVTKHYVDYRPSKGSCDWHPWSPWPLSNVRVGVSVEDQDHVSRIADLMATPAAFRWASLEPLLGPVNLAAVRDSKTRPAVFDMKYTPLGDLDWLVIGGESGPGARPCDLAWIRSVVEQGKAAGVPVYVKQLGAQVSDSGLRDVWCNGGHHYTRRPDDPLIAEAERTPGYSVTPHKLSRLLRDRKGADMSEWPEDLRVRELPR